MLPFSLQKSTKIASKIDLGRHQFFDRFLHRIFIDFCTILEANLAPCWPHFRSKWGGPVACSPLFCWVYVLFRFFGRPGPLLAPFGLDLGRSGARFWKVFGVDFGRFWARFWKLLVTIWAYDYSWKIYGSSWKTYSFSFGSSWKTCSFDPFCWRLVLDGLVGLREAQRISPKN